MTRKAISILVLTLLLSLLLALPTLAKVSEKEKQAASQSTIINQFGLPQYELETDEGDVNANSHLRGSMDRWRTPLGASSTPGLGVGEVIDNTYNDLQRYVNEGRNVEHSYDTANGYVDVHFVYEEFDDVDNHPDDTLFASPNKTGYNVWNANDSTWPWGQEAGCLLQEGDSTGSGATTNRIEPGSWLDVLPSGLVVFGTSDNYSAAAQAAGWVNEDDELLVENHFYFQEDRHSCFYDTGGFGSNSTSIPRAGDMDHGYQPGMLADTATDLFSGVLSMATQQVGGETILHVIIRDWPDLDHERLGAPNGETWHTIKYFRKLGGDYTGTWEEGQVIDTVWRRSSPSIAASRGSAKVAVAYLLITDFGALQDNERDSDLMYRESINGGVDWSASINVSQYRRDTISATGGYAVQTLYDLADNLHIIWRPTVTSMNPYRDNYFWGDFSCDFVHWSSATGVISKVAHGDYGIAANSATCGMGSPGTGYIAGISLSECDGNLYATWMQIHRHTYELGLDFSDFDDCSTDAGRTHRANWEVYVSVSSSMQGLLWDAPRNLTGTYTPGCDSALGDSGACGSEYKPAAEKYGLNEAGLGLKWPPGALADPDTIAFGIDSAYDGDYFINMMYLDDEYPGSWYSTAGRRNDVARLNALKWLRLACVDPIQASQIAAAPRSVSWTDELAWVKNGGSSSITITVSNDGNQALDVYEIATVEITGSGWLSTSVPSLGVPAGIPNTGTLDVQIDASGLTYGLGNSSWLDGEILLISDAGNIDTLVLSVHILAADTVEPVMWDTAATSTAWDPEKGGPSATGDNTALSVSNWGEFGAEGMNGDAQANLDFFLDGGECRTGDRGQLYAWGGSPYIIQHDGGETNLRITTSFNLTDQAEEYSFDPLVTAQGITGGVSGGGEYDSVYSGAFANRDTSLILERTFFAPRNNPDNPSFMVCKTVMYSGDGQQHDNVTIGSFTDWDIPSVTSPDNTVGTSAPGSPAGQFVYAQGTDADTNEVMLLCQDNVNRYGAELFLDWHTNTEYNLDDCAANDTTWGSWGASQLLSDDEGAGEPDVQQWYDSLSAKNGAFANDSSFDQSVWVTYLFDHSVGATDTLTFYSLWATLHDGSLSTFEGNIVNAKAWYLTNIRGAACATCCTGNTVGNVDCQGIIDIGDVTVMIQNLFITLNDPCCEDEADVDQSGLVDIGDLTIIISSLFITLNDMNPCP